MFLLLLALQGLAPTDQGPETRRVYHGGRGELDARPPRLEARPVVDGVLDEPVWHRAAILTGFSQFSPVDGRPAEDSTEILVWYSSTAIYFGVRAFESHGSVNATLAERDKIESDDRIEILLDTFNDRRLALSFGVNPLGVQADGFRDNSPIARADFTTDFVFQSKGRLTDYGYEVEIRIPFKSIRFQGGGVQDWGFNVIRLVQHSKYEETWTPAKLANGPLVSQSGQLVGLSDLHRGLVLDVNPFAIGKVNGVPGAAGWAYDASPEFGANARWGITPSLALDAAVNPDFSQVEADAGQIPEDVRFALFFAEKRPFFLDGIEKYATLNRLIYTRRLADPIAGIRLTGKVAGTSVEFISGVDDPSTSPTGDHPVYNWLRLRRDLKGLSTAGLTYTDKIDGSAFNRVGSADIHLVWKKQYFVDIQGAGSITRVGGVTRTAPLWEAAFDCTGRFFGCRYGIKGIHPDFSTASGFVPRVGFIDASSISRITVVQGRRGAAVERWNLRLNTNFLWDYRSFTPTEAPRESRATFASPFNLRGGWLVTPGMNWQTYRFDPTTYAGYAVERARPTGIDTTAFAIPGRINDVWFATMQVTTPQLPTFTASMGGTYGMDVAFFEPARARVVGYNASIDWRPTGQIRINAQYNHLHRNRERDGTRFSTQHIPRLKLEYQISRPIFLRFVGQYNIAEQDALRDPVTDGPILQRGSSGTYVRTTARRTNDLRVDWLFSYRPTPGTVIFAGYGSSLTETDPFTFRDLRRTRDGFFLKLSYLFRAGGRAGG